MHEVGLQTRSTYWSALPVAHWPHGLVPLMRDGYQSQHILYGRLPPGKRHVMLAFEISLQSYIRPLVQAIRLLALMEFAGGSPHLLIVLE